MRHLPHLLVLFNLSFLHNFDKIYPKLMCKKLSIKTEEYFLYFISYVYSEKI
jgi:hypothetical protein